MAVETPPTTMAAVLRLIRTTPIPCDRLVLSWWGTLYLPRRRLVGASHESPLIRPRNHRRRGHRPRAIPRARRPATPRLLAQPQLALRRQNDPRRRRPRV